VFLSRGSLQHIPSVNCAHFISKSVSAYVKSFGTPKLVIDRNRKVTIRLQGIDAPELHYQPQSLARTKYKGKDLGSLKGTGLVKEYRQHQAETATYQLGQYLATLGASPLQCQFYTEVTDEEGPSDAIDKYGRFVGNVLIKSVDVNLEILRRGWAIVAFYNSMQRTEIQACLDAWHVGVTIPGGIVRHMTKTIGAFESNLVFRHDPTAASIGTEKASKFIHPKLYRRQCTWWAYRKVGTFPSGFDTFLTLSKGDVFFELARFLAESRLAADALPLEKMVKDGKRIVYGPDEVVFKEASSRLYDANGTPIDQW
jgi:hypothetical protein